MCSPCRGWFSEYHLYERDLRRLIGSRKRAWKYACRRAGVAYCWHDLRRNLVSRLAENPAVSEETIRALAGHVRKQMLQLYSHSYTVTYGCTPKKPSFWVSKVLKSKIRYARMLARGHKIGHNR